MRKVTLYLPEEIARELKVRAAGSFTSIGAIVSKLVDPRWEKEGGTKKKK